MTEKSYTLGRNEIIRGFKSFERVLSDSKSFASGAVKAFVSPGDIPAIKQAGVPHVKVGFLLSKKK